MDAHDLESLRNLRGALATAHDAAYLRYEFIADGTENLHYSDRTEDGESAWNLYQACSLIALALDHLDHAIDPAWRDHLPADPTA